MTRSSVAVIIKTFEREKRLFNTLDSFVRHCDVSFRFYILDDGSISETKQARYRQLINEGHYVEVINYRMSVTASRNYLVTKIGDEQFVLRIDDDFEISEQTNISKMVTILEGNPSIGVVADLERQYGHGKGILSGQISAKQGFLKIKDNLLFKHNRPVQNWSFLNCNGVRFAYCDFSRNFLLIKREVFQQVMWDERIFFGVEHEDFMLSLLKSNWKLAFTPDSIHNHREDIVEEIPLHNYLTQRSDLQREDELKEYLLTKWGFDKRINKYPLVYLVRRKLNKFFTIK